MTEPIHTPDASPAPLSAQARQSLQPDLPAGAVGEDDDTAADTVNTTLERLTEATENLDDRIRLRRMNDHCIDGRLNWPWRVTASAIFPSLQTGNRCSERSLLIPALYFSATIITLDGSDTNAYGESCEAGRGYTEQSGHWSPDQAYWTVYPSRDQVRPGR